MNASRLSSLRPFGFGSGLGLVLLSIWPALAAERVVRIDRPAPVAKGLAAYPRIAEPADAAERKINAAVTRLDAKARKAAAECTADAKASPAGNGSSWQRTVRVPMRGPRYISYVVTDDVYCGGAHPNVSTMAIVYDLSTGNPIDWSTLLPASYTGKPALQAGADGTQMIVLSGKALYGEYRKRYQPTAEDAKDKEVAATCREAIADGGSAMTAWLDARQAALVVQFDLPHAVQVCAAEVEIPLAALRAAGAKPALVDAIEAAHKEEKR